MASFGIKLQKLNQDQSEPMDVDVDVAVGAGDPPPLGSELVTVVSIVEYHHKTRMTRMQLDIEEQY